MKFTGYGVVWNPKKNKALCNFKDGAYETIDLNEIEILKACPQAAYVSGEEPTHVEYIPEIKVEKKTRKQLILEAKEAGIKGADRMKTDAIIEALGD